MRFFVTLVVFICSFVFLKAQVYHFETGKVIPGDKPGLFNFRDGVFNSYPAEYSILLAHENSTARNSRLISIPVIRIKALNKDSICYPIFLLYGGPGESNLKKDFLYDELLQYHDIVIVGYRGVDGQVKLDCPNVKEALLSADLNSVNSETYFSSALSTCAEQLHAKGIDIKGYTISEVVGDIYNVRKAFGYDKISFLSFSYGTIVAQQFAFTYPLATQSLLLVGARPVNNLVIDGDVLDEQLLKFYNYYHKPLNDSGLDSSALLIDLKDRFEKIMTLSPIIKKTGLVIYSFSQLYTLNSIEDFLKAAFDMHFLDSTTITDAYKEFYKKYPGEVLLGDMYLKKQGRMNYDSLNLDVSTIGRVMALELNRWYSPVHNLLSQSKPLVLDTLMQNTLFICGELDVASPPKLLQHITPYFKNGECIELPKTGHLDFFFDKKAELDSLIIDFYRN